MDYLKIILNDALLPAVAVFVLAFLRVLGRVLIKKIEEKFQIDIDENTERRMLGIIASGVGFAEEWGRKQLKAEIDTTGEEKLQQAVAYIIAEANKAGFDSWLEKRGSDLAKLIEARLNKTRESEVSV